MNKIMSLVAFLAISYFVCAQKPVIDTSAINNWPSLASPSLSPDGKFCLYTVSNYSSSRRNTLIIQSATLNGWKMEIVDGTSARFSDDSKKVFYLCHDTLNILFLETKKLRQIEEVKLFVGPRFGSAWVAWIKKDSSLFILNPVSGVQNSYSKIIACRFNDAGNALLLTKIERSADSTFNSLIWINLNNVQAKKVWTSDMNIKIFQTGFSLQGKSFAFIAAIKKGNLISRALWYFTDTLEKAVKLLDKVDTGDNDSLTISSNQTPIFNKSGDIIFIFLERSRIASRQSNLSKVDIWSYKDKILQTQQQKQIELQRQGSVDGPQLVAAVFAKTGKTIMLENDSCELVSRTYLSIYDQHVLIKNLSMAPTDFTWSKYPYTLFSLKDGSRVLLAVSEDGLRFSFSPDGRYLVYFSRHEKTYYAYDLLTGKIKNISQQVPISLVVNKNDRLDKRESDAVGIAGWMDNGSLLIYDNYDLWKLSVKQEFKPINLTNGYGQKNKIKFRLIGFDRNEMIPEKDTLLLSAFSIQNKYNGFFSVSSENRNPVRLSMMPNSIYRIQQTLAQDESSLYFPIRPLKAHAADQWLVQIMAASAFPNLYITRDFKNFSKISNIHPEKDYNWLTSELVNWKLPDGRQVQGVLYKPESFDSTKKYPVIFHYYESMSDRVFEFPRPDLSEGELNIPWFVSRGYLVFTPDILLTTGRVGQSALQTVVSAAQALSKKTYIDVERMGLQGHSFGGTLTNYIITHTRKFAAAVEAAGVSDWITGYLSLRGNGISRYYVYENSQSRIGYNLWQAPKQYLENSAILKLDKVKTPVLIMHNRKDGNVPWEQGLELYLGLRRLQKPAWMLQYDDGAHMLFNVDALDYTIRMTQFFDHYLKGSPAPVWMTQGVAAKLKQIESGYALDPAGNCGKDCKVCKMWNERMRKDSARTMKKVKEMEGK